MIKGVILSMFEEMSLDQKVIILTERVNILEDYVRRIVNCIPHTSLYPSQLLKEKISISND